MAPGARGSAFPVVRLLLAAPSTLLVERRGWLCSRPLPHAVRPAPHEHPGCCARSWCPQGLEGKC